MKTLEVIVGLGPTFIGSIGVNSYDELVRRISFSIGGFEDSHVIHDYLIKGNTQPWGFRREVGYLLGVINSSFNEYKDYLVTDVLKTNLMFNKTRAVLKNIWVNRGQSAFNVLNENDCAFGKNVVCLRHGSSNGYNICCALKLLRSIEGLCLKEAVEGLLNQRLIRKVMSCFERSYWSIFKKNLEYIDKRPQFSCGLSEIESCISVSLSGGLGQESFLNSEHYDLERHLCSEFGCCDSHNPGGGIIDTALFHSKGNLDSVISKRVTLEHIARVGSRQFNFHSEASGVSVSIKIEGSNVYYIHKFKGLAIDWANLDLGYEPNIEMVNEMIKRVNFWASTGFRVVDYYGAQYGHCKNIKQGLSLVLLGKVEKARFVGFLLGNNEKSAGLSVESLCLLLNDRFDTETSAHLFNLTKDYFEDPKEALEYIINNNTSHLSKGLGLGNWQLKRYFNDLSYIRMKAGYRCLRFFDKNIPPSSKCIRYLGLVKNEDRGQKSSVLVKFSRNKRPGVARGREYKKGCDRKHKFQESADGKIIAEICTIRNGRIHDSRGVEIKDGGTEGRRKNKRQAYYLKEFNVKEKVKESYLDKLMSRAVFNCDVQNKVDKYLSFYKGEKAKLGKAKETGFISIESAESAISGIDTVTQKDLDRIAVIKRDIDEVKCKYFSKKKEGSAELVELNNYYKCLEKVKTSMSDFREKAVSDIRNKLEDKGSFWATKEEAQDRLKAEYLIKCSRKKNTKIAVRINKANTAYLDGVKLAQDKNKSKAQSLKSERRKDRSINKPEWGAEMGFISEPIKTVPNLGPKVKNLSVKKAEYIANNLEILGGAKILPLRRYISLPDVKFEVVKPTKSGVEIEELEVRKPVKPQRNIVESPKIIQTPKDPITSNQEKVAHAASIRSEEPAFSSSPNISKNVGPGLNENVVSGLNKIKGKKVKEEQVMRDKMLKTLIGLGLNVDKKRMKNIEKREFLNLTAEERESIAIQKSIERGAAKSKNRTKSEGLIGNSSGENKGEGLHDSENLKNDNENDGDLKDIEDTSGVELMADFFNNM